jgi:Rrf2 family protein
MKLSKKCEYALLILIDLAKHFGDGDVSSAMRIAADNGIPKKFLDQIMGLLKKNGYVKSVRGSAGGYALGRAPAEINLAEVIRLVDGPIAPVASVSEFFYRHTPSERNAGLLECFQEIRDFAARKLEGVTLDRLI